MTRATPDWLLELRNARGAGIDAIALFRGAEPSVIVEAITDCEIRTLPVGATLLQPGQPNDTIYVLLSGQLGRSGVPSRLPIKVPPSTWFVASMARKGVTPRTALKLCEGATQCLDT